MKTPILLLILFNISSFRNQQQNNNSNTLTSNTSLSVGLVVYFPFNGNDMDESGNQNHPSLNTAILTEDRFGSANSAYGFNGIDSEIRITNPFGNSVSNNNPVSISMWFKTTANTPSSAFINYYTACTTGEDYFFTGIYNGNRLSFTNGVGLTAFEQNNLNNGEWHHIAISYDGSWVQFYLNGKLNTQNFQSSSQFPLNGIYDMVIGNLSVNQCNDPHYFMGSIDEVRVYNRPITCLEVQKLYTENSSANILSGIINNNLSISASAELIMDSVIVINPYHLESFAIETELKNQTSVLFGGQLSILSHENCPD